MPSESEVERPLRQVLRSEVAVWREAVGEPVIIANIVELGAEVSEIVVVSDVLLEPIHLRKFHPFVEGVSSRRRHTRHRGQGR